MKKYILVFAAVLIFAPAFAWAQTTQDQDLGMPNVSILPSSPFYFLKEWFRGLERLLTFNSVSRAELELGIINEKAAEIKKLWETDSQGARAITKAIESYKENQERLKSRLEALKDTSENPNIDKLLEKLADRLIKHEKVFEEIAAKFDDIAVSDAVSGVKNKIEEILSSAAEKESDSGKNISEKVGEMIKEAQEMVDKAGAQFLAAKEDIRDNTKNLLEQAKSNLERAQAALAESKYGEAYGQARSALSLAENAIKTLVSGQDSDQGEDKPNSKICTEEYNPVCGVDGKTYSNECRAISAGVAVKSNGACSAASVTYAGGRFAPASLKIKKGDTVVWTNASNDLTWPASAFHPTHQVYPGFDALKGLGKGESYSFMFDKVGSWKYHDHLNPSSTGVIVVE